MLRNVERVHLTYEILKHPDPLEYRKAITAAMFGDDPTLAMSSQAQEVFHTLPTQSTETNLTSAGKNLRRRMKKLDKVANTSEGEVKPALVRALCILVISTALYYKKPETSVLARAELTKDVVTLLHTIRSVAKQRGVSDAFVIDALLSASKHAHTLYTEDTDSSAFDEALGNVVRLRDYLEEKQQERR